MIREAILSRTRERWMAVWEPGLYDRKDHSWRNFFDKLWHEVFSTPIEDRPSEVTCWQAVFSNGVVCDENTG